jgi:hypothetical protein
MTLSSINIAASFLPGAARRRRRTGRDREAVAALSGAEQLGKTRSSFMPHPSARRNPAARSLLAPPWQIPNPLSPFLRGGL